MKIVLFEEARTEAFLALVAVPHKHLAISLEYVFGEFCKSRRTCIYFLLRNTSDIPATLPSSISFVRLLRRTAIPMQLEQCLPNGIP